MKNREIAKLNNYHGTTLIVTSHGRVFKLNPIKELNQYGVTNGYKHIQMKYTKWIKHKYVEHGIIAYKNYPVHRLVAESFYGYKKYYNQENNSYTVVNHKDGNKSNNVLSNIEWCSPKENNTHAIKTGLRQKKLAKRQ